MSKGKETLKVRETKSSMLRQSFRKKGAGGKEEASKEPKPNKVQEATKEDVNSSGSDKSGVSSSSEEILVCELNSSSGSSTGSVLEVETEAKVFTIVSPPRQTPPEGVVDFDLETAGDPAQHAEYALQTFQYYKNREAVFTVPSYIEAQNEITEAMRGILVDWLVEVQESFELNHETLYTAVKLTDLYLSKKQVKKEDLQLVGATAALIACKIDERLPPLVDDFLYVCDDAYTRDELMKLERKMLNVVGFDLGYSLSYRFLRRYGRVCKVSMPVLTLARYILETSLMEYSLNIETSESKLAAAAMVLALTMKDITGYKATLEYYSGYKLTDLNNIVQKLLKMLQRPAKENLKTIRSKYSHQVFHEVATTPVPDSVNILDMDN